MLRSNYLENLKKEATPDEGGLSLIVLSYLLCGADRTNLAWIETFLYGEFDPGSERTLAAWIRHASRTRF